MGGEIERQTRSRLAVMAEMQARHNEQIHPRWVCQGYEYYRAVWVECAELLDHFGWKWWRRQARDLAQVKLEVVDIWHFGLSDLLRRDAVDDALAARIDSILSKSPESPESPPAVFQLAVEELARSCLASRCFDLDAFARMMRALPLGFDELFEVYVGKNVLNRFRQDNGYRSGSYRKVWDGREDNQHLAEIVETLDAGAASFPDDIAAALAERYAASRSP